MKQPHQADIIRELQSERPLTGVRILLVEDEVDVANLLLFILEEAGAEVVWVMQSGGVQA